MLRRRSVALWRPQRGSAGVPESRHEAVSLFIFKSLMDTKTALLEPGDSWFSLILFTTTMKPFPAVETLISGPITLNRAPVEGVT